MLHCEKFGKGIKMNGSINHSGTKLKFLIQTLIIKLKLADSDIYAFENWEWISISSCFCSVWTVKNLMQRTKNLNRMLCHKFRASDWNLDGGKQTCSYGETWVRIPRWNNIKIFSRVFELSAIRLWCTRQKQENFNGMLCQRLEAFDWDLGWRKQAISHGEVNNLKSRFFKNIGTFFTLPVYQDCNAMKKNKDFSKVKKIVPVQVEGFLARHRLKNWTLFFRRKGSCIMKEIQY